MATATKQTRADARQAALDSHYTPFYAAAGLTDLVAESIKNVVLTTQEKANKRFSELQSKGTEQAKSATEFVKTFPEQVKALPETSKAKFEEWEQQRKEFLAEANSTYGDLAGRGKKVIDDTLLAARKTRSDVEEKLDDIREDVAETFDPAFEKVQEGVTQIRRNVTGKSATETMTPKSAAQAAATRREKEAKAEANREAEAAKRAEAAQKAAATRKANAAKKAAEAASA